MNSQPQTSFFLHTIVGQDATYEFYDEPTALRWCQQEWASLPPDVPRPRPRLLRAPAWTATQFQQLSRPAQTEKDAHRWRSAPYAVARFHLDSMRAAMANLEAQPSSTHFEWLKRMGFAAQSPEIAGMLIKEVMQNPGTYATPLYHHSGHLRWLMNHDLSFHEFCKSHPPKPSTNSKGYWPNLRVRSLLGIVLSYDELQHALQCHSLAYPLKTVGATHGCLALEGHWPAQVWSCYRGQYQDQDERVVTAWSSLPLVRDYQRVLHGNFEQLECPRDPRLFLLNEASHRRLSSAQFYAEVLRIAQKPVPFPTPSILPLPSIG